MPLLLGGVLEELLGNRLGVDACRHEVVVLVAKDTHDLGRECFVQNGDDPFTIGAVGRGDRPGPHLLARIRSNLFDIEEKRLTLRLVVRHGSTPLRSVRPWSESHLLTCEADETNAQMSCRHPT